MAGRVIYLVRHGHCEGAGTLLGQSDVPLTALGLQQAEALAGELSAAGVERVVSSDLRRAVQTAEPIAERSRAPLSLDPRLREISYGSVDGSPWREGLEPAEPLEAFQRRVREAWQSILAGPARVAVVVAHLGVHAVILDDLGWRQHYGTAHRLELP